ncbi:cytochrome C oxidase subunit III [Mycobacterium vulneris]|uniref:Probable cytochrome c oxidase subunit 3 n=1 Tax=Mycolicibacterium vulneris TaxID=547163 RepID=A0A1X2KM94_9MYCO|nr:cytochrome c oxidase subunit 3 family protein [Mycolicibacterium vulneris]OSC22868.1 cytochrome C oxidase subunit III [Mycolicibacterium vulneris]
MTDLADKRERVRAVPGQPDMWAFVLFETLVFTGYFGFYLFSRGRNPELFLQSQAHLDLRVGVFNTLVLLLSSWSVARCVQSARAGVYGAALRDVFITATFAVAFLFFKVFEWARLVQAGNGIERNDFFMFYFFLTGIHFVHLLIGFVVLGVIVYQLRSPVRRSQEIIETGATYWHTVDFLWVLIFALLYVVR